MDFNTKAKIPVTATYTTGGENLTTTSSAAVDFSKPIGDVLESQNILTKPQTDESGRIQAMMIAARKSVEDGKITEADAKNILGEVKGGPNKGGIDFGTFAFKPEDQRLEILEKFSIGLGELKAGLDEVSHARATRSNVNNGHEIQVEAIGFIHKALHAKHVPNFDILNQASLIAQRAIDAMKFTQGEGKPEDVGRRGFKIWGDEGPELQEIIEQCEKMHKNPATFGNPTQEQAEAVKAALQASADKFIEGEQPQAAANVKSIDTRPLMDRWPSSLDEFDAIYKDMPRF